MITQRSGSLKSGFGRYTSVVNGKLLLSRWRLTWPWAGIMINRIHSPDTERDPHSHTRWFVTVCLRGWYTERVFTDPDNLTAWYWRIHQPWLPYFMPVKYAHTITHTHGKLTTLMITGRWRRPIQFWTKDGPVASED